MRRMDRGEASLTEQGLIPFVIENGPMNLAFSLRHGDLRAADDAYLPVS